MGQFDNDFYLQVRSYKEVQSGSLECKAGFTYTVIFDNSDSFFRSRKIHYNLDTVGVLGKKEKKIEDASRKEEETRESQTLESNEEDGVTLPMEDLVQFVKELLEHNEGKKHPRMINT